MKNTVISMEKVSKAYRLGQINTGTLTHDLNVWWAKVRGRPNPLQVVDPRAQNGQDGKTIWALRDINLALEQGDVLGIIGRNGAGKSTLLKILSEVTAPTTGEVKIKGRLASLLEVGTGFHPDLTGRENVYLNGAILGMKRSEIARKFDEIVDFSGVEKFIDTPVKRYSSGMYVRLAFAVAAHLEPEILVIDEVLAVGDAAFQKKCLGKMGNVAQEGRTVLFVSHNMIALQSLCPRAIWLEEGRIVGDGESAQVISDYIKMNASDKTEQFWEDIQTAPGNDLVRIRSLRVHPENNSSDCLFTMEKPLVLELELWNLKPNIELTSIFRLVTENQVVAFSASSSYNHAWRGVSWPVGLIKHVCHIPGNLLNSGYHSVNLQVLKDHFEVIFSLKDSLSFQVLDVDKREEGWYGRSIGVVKPKLKWDIIPIEDKYPHADHYNKVTK